MRLGQIGEQTLQALTKKGLLKDIKICKMKFCEHCVIGKKTNVKFGTVIHRTKGILNYVHTNVWGPTKMVPLESIHYFVTFINDFSRHCSVYTMRDKEKVLDLFVE